MNHSRSVTLLVVEDDAVDVMAIERGLRQAKIVNEMVVAKDGLEALAILRGTDGHQRLPKPYIVLLDLNLPRMNGFEFLQVLRGDAELRGTVVFVLTTSTSDEDRARAYAANIAGFIVKSEAGLGFLETLRLLEHYWRVVELP